MTIMDISCPESIRREIEARLKECVLALLAEEDAAEEQRILYGPGDPTPLMGEIQA